EQYFPDFALDAKQQPYSRSAEPRNPAALLRVTRGAEAWRVFVIRAMPGIHRPERLDRTLSLTDVVVSEAVTLRVSREPAAAVAPRGLPFLMAAAAAVVAALRPAPPAEPGFAAWPLVAALALTLAASALEAAAEESRRGRTLAAAWEAALGGGILVLSLMIV